MFPWDLLVKMVERFSVISLLAFVLSQTAFFRRILNVNISFTEKTIIAIVFGVLGILGTYIGIPVHDALANSRVVGVAVAGLLGGPVVGLMAGIIAGGHRMLLGGFTAYSCGISTILEGLFAGVFSKYCHERPMPWDVALLVGLIAESMQMGIILLVSKPFEAAWGLVSNIAMPMIIVNSLGIAIFMLIIKTVVEGQRRAGAKQAQMVLDVASLTLPFLRRGLTAQTVTHVAKIIFNSTDYDAVSIIVGQKILAHIGLGSDHHKAGTLFINRASERAMKTGTTQVISYHSEFSCKHEQCLLGSGVIVPLKLKEETIALLNLCYRGEKKIGVADMQIASGFAQLFSTQLELTEIDRQVKLKDRAELKALQAQVNPHFLFNTLNTVSSLIRTQPDTARNLLLKLSSFFRATLSKSGQNISLAEELQQVELYLVIEQARYGDKLCYQNQVDSGLLGHFLPSFTIQPIVENAVKHGLKPKEQGGTVVLTIHQEQDDILIVVKDDGIGMNLNDFNPFAKDIPGKGIGIVNVHERLVSLYGKRYGLQIQSKPGVGTKVTIRLPKVIVNEVEQNA